MHPLKELLYYKSPPRLQEAFISAERLWMRHVEYGREFREWRERIERMQWWSLDHLREWQLAQLSRLLDHAYRNVPGYRMLYDRAGVHPSDLRTLDDLAKFPTISKAQVRASAREFLASNARAYRPVPLNTSGTTGAPFQFYSDRLTESIERAYWWRARSWAGMRLMEPLISLGGKVVVPIQQRTPPFWRYNSTERQLYLSAFHLNRENLDLYVQTVRRSGIHYLKGYPSNLYVLAQHLRERNERIPMKAVFSGSEPLFDYVRDLVEDRFACKVFDWYGVSERVVTASQCECHADYHVHMETCLVEIVHDNGRAAHDGIGEVVGTCLSNYAMPLIRYRTGDVSSASSRQCCCSRGLATITQVKTKWEDILTTPDGRFISPSVLTHPFKPVKGIEKSQIIQEDLDHVLVKLVATPQFDSAQRALLLHGLRERLGSETAVDVELVSDIPKERSGKYRWVISKVPFAFNESMAKLSPEVASHG